MHWETWRSRMVKRRDRIEHLLEVDEAKREEGAVYPEAESAFALRELRAELEELRLTCELLADAAECFERPA